MPASQARVRTGRATRYLGQLRKHTDHIRHHAGGPSATEGSDTEATIHFPGGRCTLRADLDELTLHAEAETDEGLRRIEDAIAARLRTIGRRDGLTVSWTRGAASIVEALMSPAGGADPFPLYAEAHELGPVSQFAEGWYLACGYAAVDRILRNPGFRIPEPAPRPGEGAGYAEDAALRSMNRSILRVNPPDHGRMRSLISRVFTPRRITALRPTIEKAVDGLLDQLAEAGEYGAPVDFMDRFAFPLPVTVICEMLGIPAADRMRFRPLAADLTEALEPPGASPRSRSADEAARELAAYFSHLIDERRTAPGDDLVSALVAVHDADDGRLSDEELLANLILLLVAGFETTTNLLGNGLAVLLARPDLRTALRTGRIPTPEFVEEVLRFDSPVQVVFRRAHAEDLEVEGMAIPSGGTVIVLIGAANRDPARYGDPDEFDPARTGIQPLSFGAGPHICIGNSLARLEASIAFTKLLARFPDLSAAPERGPVRRDRIVLRGYETLPFRTTRPPQGPEETIEAPADIGGRS